MQNSSECIQYNPYHLQMSLLHTRIQQVLLLRVLQFLHDFFHEGLIRSNLQGSCGPIKNLVHVIILTHWGQDKMAAVSQTMFSNAFSWMKMYEFHFKFHWSLFLRLQLTIFTHWFRYWLGGVQATSHYLNQWWLAYWRIYASFGLNELTGRTQDNFQWLLK